MSEFVMPTYGEWLEEFRDWEWAENYDRERWDPSTVFAQVSPQIRDLLGLPPQRDYYRPERAALVLGTIWEWPSPLRHGATVFAVWMLRQTHRMTTLMGGEICRGLVRLREELSLGYIAELQPGSQSQARPTVALAVDGRLRDLLERFGEWSEFEPAAGQIVANWLTKTEGKTALAAWLRSEASKSDEDTIHRQAMGGAAD
jgi:hypothetical protein